MREALGRGGAIVIAIHSVAWGMLWLLRHGL